MDKNNPLSFLDSDSKRKVLQSIIEMTENINTMKTSIRKNEFTEEFRDTICTIIDFYLKNIFKIINFEVKKELELVQKEREFEEMFNRNLELLERLGKLNPDNFKERLDFLSSRINEYFYKINMGDISTPIFTSKVPLKTAIYIKAFDESNINKFEENFSNITLIKNENYYYVADSIENRKILLDNLRKDMPSAKILEINSSLLNEDDSEYYIEDFTLCISNFEDIDNLNI